jgi:phosphatidylinositol glycan class H protein
MILSGAVDRRFIPIGKILKPLLNECVTPVTCYWSLVLLLRDEEELKLVFQVKVCMPLIYDLTGQ